MTKKDLNCGPGEGFGAYVTCQPGALYAFVTQIRSALESEGVQIALLSEIVSFRTQNAL